MATMAAKARGSVLERRFRFAEHGTTLARDTIAGVTTFIVMSYIIFVNPTVLSFLSTRWERWIGVGKQAGYLNAHGEAQGRRDRLRRPRGRAVGRPHDHGDPVHL